MTDRSGDEAQLVQAYRDMYRGMLDQDVDLLDELLADGYTLTHMTGYRQVRAEWLNQVRTGEMSYHSSEERTVSVEITGETAVVVGRNVVGATIWGSRGIWPLQLTTQYGRRDGKWIAFSTVATTF